MTIPVGTLVNAAAVIAGSSLGMLLKHGFPSNIKDIIFQGLGLCTLSIGVLMMLKVENVLILIFSVLIGGILGELLKLEERFEAFGNFLKARLKSKNENFTEGLVTSFLIFCVGSMTITGAMDEGIRGNPTVMFTKSILDGFASIALAATYGSGVLFSFVPLLLFQGGLTLLAVFCEPFFTPFLVAQLAATGGVLILGIGINLLQIKKIKTSNLLPALFVSILLSWIFETLQLNMMK